MEANLSSLPEHLHEQSGTTEKMTARLQRGALNLGQEDVNGK